MEIRFQNLKKLLMLLMISLLALALAEYQMQAPTMISIDICQVRLIALSCLNQSLLIL